MIRAIDQARQTYGNIDSLVLNAGIVEPLGYIGHPEIDTNAWRAHFEVNFFPLVVALKAALPSLRNSDLGGRVVFMSSGAAVTGNTGSGPYSAAKAAMNGLCRSGNTPPSTESALISTL
jgi:NAD(P)-dependent dehydrogenase (short-subunit alcohol dehydrogenase family)